LGWKWEVLICPVSSLVKCDVVKRGTGKTLTKKWTNIQTCETQMYTGVDLHTLYVL